jgi:hypothetical protein
VEERSQLVGVPHPISSAPIPLMVGCMRRFRWVGAERAPTDGVVESGTDDDMNVEDGLGGEPRPVRLFP